MRRYSALSLTAKPHGVCVSGSRQDDGTLQQRKRAAPIHVTRPEYTLLRG